MYAKLREDSLDYKQLLVSNFFQLKGIVDRSYSHHLQELDQSAAICKALACLINLAPVRKTNAPTNSTGKIPTFSFKKPMNS